MSEINALILDDEEFSVQVLLEDVPWKECEITSANGVCSVKEAKEFMQSHSVNILICDIEMPGENGLDLVEWATEYTRFSEQPMVCIMLTCHPEYDFLRKAMQLGCLDYLLKPADMDDLTASLKKAVSVIREKKLGRDSHESHIETEKDKDLIGDVILPYIKEHLTEAFSVSDIAEHAGLNPQYMMRMFKKSTGLSVLEYVTNCRMDLAREMLLKTGWSLEVISEKTGYMNYTYFLKVFKRAKGITPGEYRKKYSGRK